MPPNKKPYFSIIVPTYNRGEFIIKALESIEKQSFKDWECLIIDDGSTDNTKEKVREFIKGDSRFQYHYQNNQERSAARNNGIKKAKGKYICFLDSDDYYLSNRLKNLHNELINKKYDVLYTGIKFEYNGSRIESTYVNPGNNILDYLAQNVIGIPQVCLKRELFENNQFNTDISIGEDFELWVRISSEKKFNYQENNATIIAVEHDDRSVNLKTSNSPIKQLKTLHYVFSHGHPGYFISKRIKNEKLSNCYFNMAKHHMLNRNYSRSILLTIRSLIQQPKNRLTRHKIYCLYKLCSRRIPKEYT